MAVMIMLIGEHHRNHEVELEEKQENEYSALLGSETSLCKNPLESCSVRERLAKLVCFSLT